MQIEVISGSKTATYSFEPQHTSAVLSFYDELINSYQIISYKATLDDGSVIHQVVA